MSDRMLTDYDATPPAVNVDSLERQPLLSSSPSPAREAYGQSRQDTEEITGTKSVL
jgi:hypothetical protein